MGIIYNLKTRTKLLLSFSVILIITIIVSLYGMLTSNDIQKGFEDFYNDNYLPTRMLGTIQVNQEKSTTEMQRIIYKAMALNDLSVIEESVEELDKLIAENDALIQEYEKSISTAEE